MRTRSENITEWAAAFCKMQGELPIAEKSSKGLRSKYADLVEVVKVSRPVLKKYGFSVSQGIIKHDGELSLCTTIYHESGQWQEDIFPIYPDKAIGNGNNYLHAFGGTITYSKRTAYNAAIGLVAEEEDDDGYSADNTYARNSNSYQSDKISSQQLSELHHALKGYEKLVDKIKAHFTIRELKDIPAKEYQWTIDKVRALKHAETGAVT